MFFITEKILVVGSNTRAVSKSLKDLGYIVYATSFFDSLDQREVTDKLLIPNDFIDYKPETLEKLALNYVDEVDHIICCSGVRSWLFPKSKIIGNKDTKNIVNKYKLYKKLHKNFLMPETYKVSNLEEAKEIASNSPEKKFLTKPIEGCGGLNIQWLDKTTTNDFQDEFLLQEYITGTPISSSFLSYSNSNFDTTMVTVSTQVIGSHILGSNSFEYCGNITPNVIESPKIYNISAKIARMYKLIGSNGVDFVFHNNNVYVIEVNPRIQGTFENIENSFNINMAKSHIDSCNNIPVKISNASKFTVKLIPYSKYDAIYNLNNIKYIHDIPQDKTIIKKQEPIVTILTSDRILENAMNKAERVLKQVYSSGKIN